MTNFDLTDKQRQELLQFTLRKLEEYYGDTRSLRVSPTLDVDEIIDYLRRNSFEEPAAPKKIVADVIDGLKKYGVHTPHPMYFGLYNPRANAAGILADLITAVFNPQLAAWSHAPYAVEVENHVIREVGKKFGYQKTDGTFTTGGAEANLTAVLCALNKTFAGFAKEGIAGIQKKPIIYSSSEAHHSIVKAAKNVGLGYLSVRDVQAGTDLKIDVPTLVSLIQQDIDKGCHPFMIVGTAGTTGTGVIDDLPQLSNVADDYDLWFHVDAAYGGGAVLNKELKAFLKGIEHADSITFDAHKWMSVPMGTSMYLTSDEKILEKTFGITTEYMPKEAGDLIITDPFTHSIQWSRRFIGLKVYLSLQIFGWKGYEEVIGHQARTGNILRQKLKEHNWSIKNDTPLPVICFTDDRVSDKNKFAKAVSQKIINSGQAWLSVYPVNNEYTLRACITNYSTTELDIEELISGLNDERERYLRG